MTLFFWNNFILLEQFYSFRKLFRAFKAFRAFRAFRAFWTFRAFQAFRAFSAFLSVDSWKKDAEFNVNRFKEKILPLSFHFVSLFAWFKRHIDSWHTIYIKGIKMFL